MALTVRERGSSEHLVELFDLANALQLRLDEWMQTLRAMHNTLSGVAALYPDSLAYT